MSGKSAVADNALIVDLSMSAIAVGERIRQAVGSAATGDFVYSLVAPGDALRFEQFVRGSAPFDSFGTVEFGVCNLKGYTRAVACRRNTFGRDSVLITFYKNRNELLYGLGAKLSSGGRFAGSECASGDASPDLEETREIVRALSAEHPKQAAQIEAALDSALRRAMTSDLICRIITGQSEHDPYDPVDLAARAAEYVAGVTGAAVSFDRGDPGDADTDDAEVSPEHLWYLVTAAVTAAIDLSDGAPVSVSAGASDGAVRLCFFASGSPFASGARCGLTLGELRELFPRSSLRLYLCELICEESGIGADVECGADGTAISLTIPTRRDGHILHSTAFAAILPEWLEIAGAVIIGNEK